jgi:hypothetical protein
MELNFASLIVFVKERGFIYEACPYNWNYGTRWRLFGRVSSEEGL